MSKAKWVKLFLYILMFVMSFIILFNYIINPFNVFEPNINSTFNRYKKHIYSDRMTLFYELDYVKPKTLVVGSSRVGYFKNYLLEPYVKKPIFNLSLAGASIYEQAQYIKYIIKNYDLEELIWSLDFYAFNPDKLPYNGYSDKRLNNFIYLDDYFTALMSYRTFEISLKTLKENLKNDTTRYSPLFEENQYIDFQGQTFKKKEIEKNIQLTLGQYKSINTFLKSKKFKNPHSIDPKLSIFRDIINLCRKNNIKIKVYTSPVYLAHLKLINELGLTKTFRYWKQEIAKITPFTDFCYKNDITTNIMNFRDSSHTISDTGKLIFKKIYNDDLNTSLDFGINY